MVPRVEERGSLLARNGDVVGKDRREGFSQRCSGKRV